MRPTSQGTEVAPPATEVAAPAKRWMAPEPAPPGSPAPSEMETTDTPCPQPPKLVATPGEELRVIPHLSAGRQGALFHPALSPPDSCPAVGQLWPALLGDCEGPPCLRGTIRPDC